MDAVLTPEFVDGCIPYGFWTRARDAFRAHEQYTIQLNSPGDAHTSPLWNLFTWERGVRQTLIIEGPPGFCQAVLAELRKDRTEFMLVSRRRVDKACG
jgi:hypothetical protein